MMTILDRDSLELIVQEYARISETIQYKHLQYINITKQSKDWWNDECQTKLRNYRSLKLIDDWKSFKGVVKKTKRLFFNNKIQEITSKNQRSQNLMNWVKKHKLLAIKALQFNSKPYIEIKNLWQVLHQMFNLTQNHHINLSILNEILSKPTSIWMPFSKEKFKSVIMKDTSIILSTLPTLVSTLVTGHLISKSCSLLSSQSQIKCYMIFLKYFDSQFF